MKRLRVALSRPWPAELPLELAEPLLGFMREAEVGEIVFVPQGEGYAIRFNADLTEVPGVWLPPEVFADAEALLDLVKEALSIYYEELNQRG